MDVGSPASSLDNLRLRKGLVSASIFVPASSSSVRSCTLVDPPHPHHWEVDPMNVRTPGSLWMSDQLDPLTGAQQPLSASSAPSSVWTSSALTPSTPPRPKNVWTLALLSRLFFFEMLMR